MKMKKKTMKREYTTPQCSILSEEVPFLLAVSGVNMNVGNNDPENPLEAEDEETGW